MKELLKDNVVLVEYDVQKRGPYKRDLVYVFLEDGTHVNAELEKNGLTRVSTYPPNVRYEKLYYKLQVQARKDIIGTWSNDLKIIKYEMYKVIFRFQFPHVVILF
jgi:micrococcal nuclease